MTKDSETVPAKETKIRKRQFGLRTLIILFVLLSIVFAICSQAYRRYTRPNRIADAVSRYGGNFIIKKDDCLASNWLVKFGFEPLSSIRDVTFQNENTLDDEGLELISGASEIEYLIVYSDQVTESGLLQLGKLKKLKDVNLSGLQVTDRVLQSLPKQELESLYAYATAITDESCQSLTEATKLTYLCLGKSKITDDACKSFGKITSLTYMEIGKNDITDEGLPHLYSLTNLEFIDLIGTKSTREGRRKLEQAVPGLRAF